MTRTTLTALTLTILLLLSGTNLVLSLRNGTDISREFRQGCTARKVVAAVGAEALKEQHESNQLFLSKGSIPGYSQKELSELTLQKETKEQGRIGRLETVVKESC